MMLKRNEPPPTRRQPLTYSLIIADSSSHGSAAWSMIAPRRKSGRTLPRTRASARNPKRHRRFPCERSPGNVVVDLRGDHRPERAKKKKEAEEKRAKTGGSLRILHLASRGRDGETLRLLFDPLARPPHRGLDCRLQELSGAVAASVLGGGLYKSCLAMLPARWRRGRATFGVAG